VGERDPLGTRQDASLDDTIVSQSIVKHNILTATEVSNSIDVGSMATKHHNGVLHPNQVCNRGLQFPVQWLFPTSDTTGRDSGAILVQRVFGCADDVRLSSHGDVVVVGESEELAAIHDGGAAGDALMWTEEDIWPSHFHPSEPLLQSNVLWPEVEVEHFGRDTVHVLED